MPSWQDSESRNQQLKLHSCTFYTGIGVDPGGLPRCWPSYASPRIVSSGIDMFSPGPSLKWKHHCFRKLPELHSS